MLTPRMAFSKLDPKIRRLVDAPPRSLFEQDNLLLPPVLKAYRRQVRQFAETVLAPHAAAQDQDPSLPGAKEVLQAAASAGFLSDYLPRPFGSLSWQMLGYPLQWVHSVKMEELCRVCGGLGLMIGANSLGVLPLIISGDLNIIRRFALPAARQNLAGAPYLFAFAITEPHAGSDVEDTEGAAVCRPGTIARPVPGGWLLNGRKVFITGGDIADAVSVFAALEGEGMESWTCFLVKRGTQGFSVGRHERKMGQRASAATELILDDVFVPEDQVVGGLRKGWAINRAVLNFSRIPVGAIALGIAQGALDCAWAYASQTVLGRKPLINYQEIHLMLAQMTIDCSAMRALVWQSARRFTPTQAKASMTKVFCSDTAVRVCETAMEMIGNHSVLHENRVEQCFRDARLTQIYEGTNQINRLAIIEDLHEEKQSNGFA